MKSGVDFQWPKALRAVRREAEDGTLNPRPLYPVEVKALCDLVAGAPLDETAREIAPGMTVVRRREAKTQDGWCDQRRAAYYFITRFDNGRVWQCSLFSAWIEHGNPDSQFRKAIALHPKNIVQAVTRCLAPEGGAR